MKVSTSVISDSASHLRISYKHRGGLSDGMVQLDFDRKSLEHERCLIFCLSNPFQALLVLTRWTEQHRLILLAEVAQLLMPFIATRSNGRYKVQPPTLTNS